MIMACLDNVIKVGAANDNRDLVNGGIGIGGMDVDFYAKSSTSSNGGASGNSMAAPRIATALAILKEFDQTSTVEQRIEALKASTTRTNSYRFDGDNHTRPSIRPEDMTNAIAQLQRLTDGNIDNIFFEDTKEYGPFHGGSSAVYAFNIDFGQLIGSDRVVSKQANNSLTVSSVRDVALSFEGSSTTFNSTFRVFINGQPKVTTEFFMGTRDFSLVLNRNDFSEGNNSISIRTFNDNWGLKNIKADFHPVVNLTVGQTVTREYGYSHTPARFTGVRAVFDLPSVQSDYILSATGWDIDRADENEVFINGSSLGFLNQSSSSAYSLRNNFILRARLLEQGNNIIEFVQRKPIDDWRFFEDEKWAVKDLRVQQARPDLAVPRVNIKSSRLNPSVPFQATATISNFGIGSSIVGSVTRFYASADEVINSNDTVLKTVSFAPLLENTSVEVITTIQTSLVNQGLYFGACVDSVPTESFTSNNCSEAIKLSGDPVIVPIINMLLDENGAPLIP